jgi:hypothetical protein
VGVLGEVADITVSLRAGTDPAAASPEPYAPIVGAEGDTFRRAPERGTIVTSTTTPPQGDQLDQRAAEAKARRAARKAARAAIPPPTRDAQYDHLSLDDLRQIRTELGEEETRVSYWRRVIQARLDIVRTHITDGDPVADLTRVLTDSRGSRQRLAHLDAVPVDDIPPLPDLAEVWSRQVARDDAVGTARLVRDLERAEHDLSAFRSDLHHRMDHVTNELIARYREEPLLALQALPTDPLHPHVRG